MLTITFFITPPCCTLKSTSSSSPQSRWLILSSLSVPRSSRTFATWAVLTLIVQSIFVHGEGPVEVLKVSKSREMASFLSTLSCERSSDTSKSLNNKISQHFNHQELRGSSIYRRLAEALVRSMFLRTNSARLEWVVTASRALRLRSAKDFGTKEEKNQERWCDMWYSSIGKASDSPGCPPIGPRYTARTKK